jgi:hypothetical protein
MLVLLSLPVFFEDGLSREPNSLIAGALPPA